MFYQIYLYNLYCINQLLCQLFLIEKISDSETLFGKGHYSSRLIGKSDLTIFNGRAEDAIRRKQTSDRIWHYYKKYVLSIKCLCECGYTHKVSAQVSGKFVRLQNVQEPETINTCADIDVGLNFERVHSSVTHFRRT